MRIVYALVLVPELGALEVTNPGFKTLYRIYDKKSGMAFADLIALEDENLNKPLTLTHETERWKTTTLDVLIVERFEQIFVDIARRHHHGIGETRLVKHFARKL